ncbi:MAG: PAS domain-containing protein [Proteobacteria bacterium]|nr:PAS domain-containing protein [Pseudomonadota bacterium]
MHICELAPVTGNCQTLAAAWAGWRGDKILPRRSNVRLADITGSLPWIALVDVFSETEIIFRLAGTMIREIMGVELTGRNLMELTDPAHRLARGVRTVQTAHQPCGALWVWNVTFENRNIRPVENLSLPLWPDEDGRPMQNMNVCGMLDTASSPRAINNSQCLASAAQHSFVNIGASLPGAASQD